MNVVGEDMQKYYTPPGTTVTKVDGNALHQQLEAMRKSAPSPEAPKTTPDGTLFNSPPAGATLPMPTPAPTPAVNKAAALTKKAYGGAAGRMSEVRTRGSMPAVQKPPVTPADTVKTDEQKEKSKPSTTTGSPSAYSMGGAGVGALLGAVLAGKKKRTMGAIVGGGLGGTAGLLAHSYLNSKKAEEEKTAYLENVSEFFKNIHSKAMENDTTKGMLYGGLGGAALGGLHGLIAPGHEDIYDNMGRVTGQRQRGRFGAALRGATGGAVAGAGAGAAMGQFAPKPMNTAINHLHDFGNTAYNQAQHYGSQAYQYGRQMAGAQ